MAAKSVFVIAEAGVNHNGDPELACELVRAAAKAGADAVKFQTFKAEKLVAPGTAKAAYQEKNTGSGDQLGMLRSLELSEETHRRLFALCAACGIEFMSTPFDEESADFLVSLGMKRIKVPSGELTNHPFLAFLAAKKLPIIISTGMADLDEIAEAVDVIRRAWAKAGETRAAEDLLTVLHCTSDYPARLQDVNLRAMGTIAERVALPVGYSDHTQGILVSLGAVAMGAGVIEKHFTLDKELPGPDHKASLSLEELDEMVASIRAMEVALGSPEKAATEAERPVRALVRRSVVATRPIAAGEILSGDNLSLLRPGTGIPPSRFDEVLGKRALRDLPAGQVLAWDDIAS
jgi:N,N'-diacetyllegionaminate synthase